MFSWYRNERQTILFIDDFVSHGRFIVEIARKISNQLAVIICAILSLMIIDFYGDAIAMLE